MNLAAPIPWAAGPSGSHRRTGRQPGHQALDESRMLLGEVVVSERVRLKVVEKKCVVGSHQLVPALDDHVPAASLGVGEAASVVIQPD